MTLKNTSEKSQYYKLEEVFRSYYFLKRTLSLLSWDAAVMMPPGSEKIRSEQLSIQTMVMNKTLTNSKTEKLFEKAEQDFPKLTPWQQANFREMGLLLKLKRAIPPRLEGEIASKRVLCEKAWGAARKKNDYKLFESSFSPLLKLIRQKGDLLGEAFGVSSYEGLIQEYDPGGTDKDISDLFKTLSLTLPSLIFKIKAKQEKHVQFSKSFPPLSIGQQVELSRKMLLDFGFNFNIGRFDQSAHPFTEGSMDDIRITTHFKSKDPLSGLLGAIHECGHALYDTNLPRQWIDQPVGQERGMSVHEGIALYFEMILARSKGFAYYLSEQIGLLGISVNIDDLYFQLLKINPYANRIDADEASYILHIILRYEIESMLIKGDLKVQDIPEYWEHKTKDFFGYAPARLADGCLQDIHWAVGLFGYFPSYGKGLIFAINLFYRLGEFKDFFEYPGKLKRLKEEVFNQGAFLKNREILNSPEFSKDPAKMVISYLSQKYLNFPAV